MAYAKLSDEEFREAWIASGGQAAVLMRNYGYSNVRGIYDRRNAVERRHGWHLPSGGAHTGSNRGDAGLPAWNYRPRLEVNGFSGLLVTFSDAHWWPGISDTLAYKALLEVIKQEKPAMIVANGDLLDAARISSHSRIRWDQSPRLADELEEVKARMAEIRHACRKARLIRTTGNHCARFETYLSNRASEAEGLQGTRLSDHLLGWEETMSLWVNNQCVIKHRIGQGRHAAYSNLQKAGSISGQTGHTHRLLVEVVGNYRGRFYWAESGTLAEPGGPQFAYAEDNPTEACSGFLTTYFGKDQTMYCPQMVEVQNGRATWKDQIVARDKARAA